MPYVEKSRRPLYLLIGFIGMFFCGIGDILFSFRGEGEPTAVSGMMSMNITEVPLYFILFRFHRNNSHDRLFLRFKGYVFILP